MGHEDPYRPPTARLSPGAADTLGSPLIAVLVGLVVDIGGTLLTNPVIGVAYATHLAASGMQPEQIVQVGRPLADNPVFTAIEVAVGLGFSVLGGYLCARIVGRDEYRWATVMAVLELLVGLAFTGEDHAIGFELAMFVLSCCAVLSGAWVKLKTTRSEERQLAC